MESELREAAARCGLEDDDGSRSIHATIQSGLNAGIGSNRPRAHDEFDNRKQERVFAGTAWAGGAWRDVLRYLRQTAASDGVLNFGGWKSRATVIPAAHLPIEETYDTGRPAVEE